MIYSTEDDSKETPFHQFTMRVTYIPYTAKKVLNIYKHIDGGWFWNKYSAYPYSGCQFGCDFCYEREPKSPAVKLCFKAMEAAANRGILTGTAFMPILPFVSDSEENLETVVKMTGDHGGSFVLAGSLTLSGYQRQRYLSLISKHYPELVSQYDKLYQGTYSPADTYWSRIAHKVGEFCHKYGIKDRMPRWIASGPLAINKRIAEKLFLKVYDLELGLENKNKIWAYRKAAWAIDELAESIATIY